MANALAQETSPYLLQHAGNPVDWLPWGERAFVLARERDVPVLISIGYSSCHWCHVMERESFEDPATAALMNEEFVCIKVDREERPDVDGLYMEAVQGMTGRGGWPLNVFVTPEQLPFYGGTYYPPLARQGMPSWTQVLQAIAESWEREREEIREGGERLREALARGSRLAPAPEPPGEQGLRRAVENLRAVFDAGEGGFGGAPKFPQAPVLELLLARGEREMSLATLRAMARGGIHDQVGGGFARYSVDRSWTVPHFEKMLYDNALLARAYLHGWQLAGEEALLEVCLDTLGWALREMRAPDGGFHAALDADSEGVEGRFYVWTVAELETVLGSDAEAAIAWLGATEEGNFVDPHHAEPGLNVLTALGPQPDPQARARIRETLLAARAARVRPALDDKRLTSWNALMIIALAETGAALAGEPRPGAPLGEQLLAEAVACAEFVLRELRDDRGRLLRSFNAGEARIGGFLEDNAYMLEASLALFESTCQERWFDLAVELAEQIIDRFADERGGGFYSTASDQERLIVRRKELEDSPIPAGPSAAAMGLLRLGQLTGAERYTRGAASVIDPLAEIAPRHPTAFGHLLQAMHWSLAPARPIACAVPLRPSAESLPGGPPRSAADV